MWWGTRVLGFLAAPARPEPARFIVVGAEWCRWLGRLSHSDAPTLAAFGSLACRRIGVEATAAPLGPGKVLRAF